MNTCSKSKSWSSLSISAACALSFLLQTVEPLQWFFSPHTHTTSFSLSGKEVLVKHMSGETKFALNFLWCSWFSSGFGLWCFQPCRLMKNFRYFLLIGHLLTVKRKMSMQCFKSRFHSCKSCFRVVLSPIPRTIWSQISESFMHLQKLHDFERFLNTLRFMSRWFHQWTARQTFEWLCQCPSSLHHQWSGRSYNNRLAIPHLFL